jgi:hypothetical protein
MTYGDRLQIELKYKPMTLAGIKALLQEHPILVLPYCGTLHGIARDIKKTDQIEWFVDNNSVYFGTTKQCQHDSILLRGDMLDLCKMAVSATPPTNEELDRLLTLPLAA